MYIFIIPSQMLPSNLEYSISQCFVAEDEDHVLKLILKDMPTFCTQNDSSEIDHIRKAISSSKRYKLDEKIRLLPEKFTIS